MKKSLMSFAIFSLIFIMVFVIVMMKIKNPIHYKEAIGSKLPVHCEFKNEGKNLKMDSFMYRDKAKTITQVTSPTPIISYQLKDGKYNYFWTDKKSLKPTKVVSTSISPATITSDQIGQNYEKFISEGYIIECKYFLPTATTFQPPKNIPFTELVPSPKTSY